MKKRVLAVMCAVMSIMSAMPVFAKTYKGEGDIIVDIDDSFTGYDNEKIVDGIGQIGHNDNSVMTVHRIFAYPNGDIGVQYRLNGALQHISITTTGYASVTYPLVTETYPSTNPLESVIKESLADWCIAYNHFDGVCVTRYGEDSCDVSVRNFGNVTLAYAGDGEMSSTTLKLVNYLGDDSISTVGKEELLTAFFGRLTRERKKLGRIKLESLESYEDGIRAEFLTATHHYKMHSATGSYFWSGYSLGEETSVGESDESWKDRLPGIN